MLIGLLSDSHGHAKPVRRALKLFDQVGVEAIIHCGDVGGESVFEELVGRHLWFVWGNTDLPSPGLLSYLEGVGLEPPASVPLILELNGKRIAVFHGHEPDFATALTNLNVDYILHGHTHVRRDEMVGGRRIINPGALHRASVKTVATLDIARDLLTSYEVTTLATWRE